LITLEDASFVIRGGYDGVVLTKDGMAVAESRLFSMAWGPHQNDEDEFAILVEPSDRSFEDVFIGFDAAWGNYYHWLCYAIVKSYIAARIVPTSCSIIIPDYIARASDKESIRLRGLRYSEDVWRESLALAGLAERVLPLPVGLYKAKRVHMIWPRIRSPTEIMNADLFYRVFSEMRSKLRADSAISNRIFISREKANDTRMNSTDHQVLEEGLVSRGFTVVSLETLPFMKQAELFYNAEIVVSPHGAGLTNVLFGADRLRVLELNRRIGDEKGLRPWFYLISSQRGLAYSYLDGTTDGFPIEGVLTAVDNLLSINRLTGTP
jgi:hypothetical protein